MSKRRVVVTGLGMLTSLGNNVSSTWDAAIAGKSGIGLIDQFDTTDFGVKIGGGVHDFDVTQYIDKKDARRMDKFIQYGIAAGVQAIDDSGLAGNVDPARAGITIGSGIGGINTIEDTTLTLQKSGPRRVSPFFIPGSVINMISGGLSIRYGFRGPNLAVVTACTTGTHNLGLGARLIQAGDADVMVTGGSEQGTSPICVAGFTSMRALSTRNDDPERASRPWDDERDGFVLGDGAAVVVLEELEHAKARGAKIYCELLGFGMSGDAYHITSPLEDGTGGQASMENALRDADLAPSAVDYINAHGTSTPLGDVAEVKGIKNVFGESPDLVVNSTKSMLGHLLGAAGSVEAVLSILAIQNQISPPTINLNNPSEGCDLDFVPNQAREMKIDVALSNSFGFGGTNGSVVLGRYSG